MRTTNSLSSDACLTSGRTVLIANDDVFARYGLRALITEVLGDAHFVEVDSVESLYAAARLNRTVCLAVVELETPGLQWGVRLPELAHQHPELPLVVISASLSPQFVRRIMDVPTVCAFVHVRSAPAQLRSAIQAAVQGRKLPFESGGAERATEAELTPRQQEICTLLRQGMSNKAIARILGISEGTVRNHITDILRALNATNRTQAARLGPQAGNSGPSPKGHDSGSAQARFDTSAGISRPSRQPIERGRTMMLDADELLHLAIHASSVGEHHACMAYLKEMLQQHPRHGKAIYLLAVQHAELGLLDRAITGMNAALLLEPDLEIARLQLGLLLLDREQRNEAKEQFSGLRGSADLALRACADAMSALADGNVILAQEILAQGLSHSSDNRALSALMQRLLDKLSKESPANPTELADQSAFLGAYRHAKQ